MGVDGDVPAVAAKLGISGSGSGSGPEVVGKSGLPQSLSV